MVAPAQMSPQQMNQLARLNLLQTGIQMVKRIQPSTGNQLGSQIRIPLLRMGIMTGITLLFTVPVGDVADPIVSPFFPHNIAQRVTYTDFAGVDRTKTNGWQLFALNSLKDAELKSGNPYAANGFGNRNTNILSTAAPADNGNVVFSLYVPLAYDPASDLTGAVLTQTNVGEHYVTIQLPTSLVGADPFAFPFVSGTVPLGGAGVTVEAYQHFIQPQNMDLRMLPAIDLSTNYGLEGAYQSTDGIAANQAKYINYPNNRAILSTLHTYINGDAVTANEADVSMVTLLANSNTTFREMSPRLVREQMRDILTGADLPNSSYYLGSRRQPIMTQLYANVQAKFDVLSVAGAGSVYWSSQFEVQYASGSPLPGITVA